MTAIIFIIVLSIIVFVHELGHFVMAKRAGMKVEEFGFGFRLDYDHKPKTAKPPTRLIGFRLGICKNSW